MPPFALHLWTSLCHNTTHPRRSGAISHLHLRLLSRTHDFCPLRCFFSLHIFFLFHRSLARCTLSRGHLTGHCTIATSLLISTYLISSPCLRSSHGHLPHAAEAPAEVAEGVSPAEAVADPTARTSRLLTTTWARLRTRASLPSFESNMATRLR